MKHRILVVEDEPVNRELLGGWLETEGFEAVLADTLEAAFILIAAEPLPEAMLLDIHLGSKNGLTLVHWARKQKHLAHIPIVAVVSMGRRNTHPKSYLQVFQWLNSLASVDSKKTLHCLGYIEYSPKDQVSLKNTIGSKD